MIRSQPAQFDNVALIDNGSVKVTLDDLRHHAIAASLGSQTTLRRALDRLAFVQADPIRSPARAEDLILRQRVRQYCAGDLQRSYRRLNLEEDYLYAYGFMPLSTWQLLHPRAQRELSASEQRVLDLVLKHKRLHLRAMEQQLGKEVELNAWGGYSKATTRTLERLHYLGLVRIAGRQNGIKLYGPNAAALKPLDPEERLRRLVLIIARILAPVPVSSLRAAIRPLRHAAPHLEHRTSAVTRLLQAGDLESAEVNGVNYAWPAGRLIRKHPEAIVRFLAPFDPLVWDRRRFELFWDWSYRFEAYTPAAKRKLGYYALPMLWKADVVGWVNVTNGKSGFSISRGFSKRDCSRERGFEAQFDAEVDRMRSFLRAK